MCLSELPIYNFWYHWSGRRVTKQKKSRKYRKFQAETSWGVLRQRWMNTISPQYLSCCSLRCQLSTKHEKWMWHTESINASHRWEEGVWGSEVTGGMSPVWRYCTSKRPAARIKAVSGSQTHGSRLLGLFCQYFFSRQFLLFSNFPFLSRLSCWLLTSRLVSCLFLHCSCLPGLSLCLVYDFSLFLIISLTRSWIRPSYQN